MKYQTQKVAMLYFYGALTLFLAQVLFGLLAGTIYVLPNTLSVLLPFNIVRMIHTNALIVWSLIGFMGATYFLLPEETETELYSPLLAKIQFWMFFGAAGVAVVGYLFHYHEGREFLEQPFIIKVGIVVVCLMFLFNVTMTALKGRKTTVTNILLFGLWGVAIFFLFAFYNPANLAVDKMYWWYVVHLWVEGVWELIMASVLAYLMIKLNGIDREVVEKWLYVIIGLALFSGISRHRPPFLLDRRARLLAVDRLAVLDARGCAVLHDGDLHGADDLEGRPQASEPRRAAVVGRLFGDGVPGSRRLGFPAHTILGELLHPRHPGHRCARPSRLLWRLCDAQPCRDGLRHPADQGTRAL